MARRPYRQSHRFLARQLGKSSRAVCPTPTKYRYATAEFATMALAEMALLEQHGPAPTNHYLCPCGWFHLTRQRGRGRVPSAGRAGDPFTDPPLNAPGPSRPASGTG